MKEFHQKEKMMIIIKAINYQKSCSNIIKIFNALILLDFQELLMMHINIH